MFVLPLSPVSRHVPRALINPQFSRIVDRLFDDSFERTRTDDAASRTPPLDVSETDVAYTVTFDVPGVSREQLTVSVEGRRVSIETVEAPKAEATAPTDASQPTPVVAKILYRERGAARYARTVSLPAEVDQTASQARFENGVLTLTLAKKVASGATRLTIN